VRSAYGYKCRRKERERKSEEEMDRQNGTEITGVNKVEGGLNPIR